MQRTTVQRTKDETEIALPEELMDALGIEAGEDVLVVETNDGLLVLPYDSDLETILEGYQDTLEGYDETLRKLAQ